MAVVFQCYVSQPGADLPDFGEEGKVQDGLEKYPLKRYLSQEASGLAQMFY